MSLRAKFIASFIGVASLILVIGIAGVIISIQIAVSFGTILTDNTSSILALLNASGGAEGIRENGYKYAFETGSLGAGNPETLEALAAAKTRMTTALDAYAASHPESPYNETLPPLAGALAQAVEDLLTLVEDGADRAVLQAQFDKILEAETAYVTELNTGLGYEGGRLNQQLYHAGDTAQSGPVIYIGGMIFALILAVVLGVVTARNVSRPIRHLRAVSDRMTAGDYAQRAVPESKDEIGQLANAFNTMAEAIQKRDAELNTMNQSLEHRVEERTKELQVAIREAQEASRLKDEFLSIMSHELRTPLNAIIGFQGIILMTAKLSDHTKHMTQRAQANAKRLLALINDILDISRIEAGRVQLAKTEISPVDLVNRLHGQMSILADEKELNFTVEIDPSVPDTMMTDEDAITKIITNLLSNAFKFTDEGSVVLRLSRAQDNLVIEIKDTGIGIPSHMHQVIFERFRQVDGSSKRTYGGSGLGLAIVQKLCLALGGSISLQSVVGEGSTFTAVVPLALVDESDKVTT